MYERDGKYALSYNIFVALCKLSRSSRQVGFWYSLDICQFIENNSAEVFSRHVYVVQQTKP